MKESDKLRTAITSDEYLGFQSFKTFSNWDITRNPLIDLVHPREKVMPRNKDWFLIGKDHYNAFNERDASDKLYIPFSSKKVGVFRMIFFGSLRSGKSMHLRRLGDIAFINGYSVCYLTDTKNEVRASQNPQHSHIAKHLDMTDIPQGFPVKIYRPLFFKEFLGERECPEGNEYFQLPYSINGNPVIDWIDLQNILGLKLKDDLALQILSLHWNKARDFEELKQRILNEPNARKPTKDKIIRAIEPLIQYKIFGNDHAKDFIFDMVGNIVAFNVRGFQRLSGSTSMSVIPQIYTKIILKMIVDAKENGKLSARTLILIDEAPVFLKEGTLTEKVIENIVKRETHLPIYIAFAAQDVKDVPEWMLTMCKYIFFPYNFELDSAKKLFEYIDISNISGTWEWKRELANIKSKMKINSKTGERQWCMINAQDKTSIIYWALPSLSQHMINE